MRQTIILLSIVVSVVACQKFNMIDLDTQISKHDESESHYKGQMCADCHYTEGNDAEGAFALSGTAYGNYKNGWFELYQDKNGSPIKTIEIDQLGNAFTTENINYGDGLFIAVKSANGETEFMDDPITHGNCNSCHGTSIEERIDMD